MSVVQRSSASPIVSHISYQDRQYQFDILNQTIDYIRQGFRAVQINSPVGSGKTYTAAMFLRRALAKNKRCWLTVHRREILRQNYLAMCDVLGDSNVGIVGAGFYPNYDAPVQVCSIGSLKARAHRLQPPDVICWDESQHLPARGWAALFSAFPKAVHIGLSGSPIRLDGRGLGEFFQKMVNGPSIQWLIDNGYLSPFRLFAPYRPDLSGVHSLGGDFNSKELSETMKGTTVTGDCVDIYQKHGNGQRGLVFAWSVESSIEVADRFNRAGVPAAHIDGTTDERTRDEAVARFGRGEIKILTNVDICAEGFSIPACELLFELRPTQSLALHIQHIGRVLRTAPGKAEAKIFDLAGNVFRHGLITDDFEFSLEGIPKKERKKKEPEDKTKVCPGCFLCVSRFVRVCPNCQHEFMVVGRSIEEVEGDLHEVDIAKLKRAARIEQGTAQSLPDLIKIAKARGYGVGWAYKVHASREKKREKREAAREESQQSLPIDSTEEADRWLSF